MKEISIKEIIGLFLSRSIHDLKSENEVPKINFIFTEDTYNLFKDIKEKQQQRRGFFIPDINDEDIELVKRQDEDTLTLEVKDGYHFFKLLQEITNESIELDACYNYLSNPSNTAMRIMRYIWLRMGIEDINNVEQFLEKQLEFYKDRTLDTSNKIIDHFYDYNVEMKTKRNSTWDETTKSMIFTIKDKNKEKEYELPRILYDIDKDNNCYIYAIQNIKDASKDKSIERKLYKINKNIDNPNIHPNKIYALIYFINELKKNDISKIIVPSIQILNYRYHEILGEKAKEELERIENVLKRYPNDFDYLLKKENIIAWYNRVYNKQDKISYLKTEELLNLMYRITLHDSSIEITNEVNIQGDSLKIKIKK